MSDNSTPLPLLMAIIITAALSLIFAAWPRIDLQAAALFYDSEEGFTARNDVVLQGIRQLGLWVTVTTVAGLALIPMIKWLRPQSLSWFHWRPWLFVSSAFAIGPWLVTDRILKSYWGRARPIQTMEFGGDYEFSRAWDIADQCQRNCSFVSGEAAASFMMLAFAFVVPPQWRRQVILAALTWTVLISVIRMAFGGHYLSDIVVAWGLMLILMFLLQRLLLLSGATVQPRPTAMPVPQPGS